MSAHALGIAAKSSTKQVSVILTHQALIVLPYWVIPRFQRAFAHCVHDLLSLPKVSVALASHIDIVAVGTSSPFPLRLLLRLFSALGHALLHRLAHALEAIQRLALSAACGAWASLLQRGARLLHALLRLLHALVPFGVHHGELLSDLADLLLQLAKSFFGGTLPLLQRLQLFLARFPRLGLQLLLELAELF